MNAEAAAGATADAVFGLPARFMFAGGTYRRGAELGFDGVDFYHAGRGGALGDVDGMVVAAAFVFFNPATVVEAWDRSRPVMARRQAAQAFAGCLDTWARRRLPDGVDYGRLGALLGRIIDAASPAASPLFAAWRSVPEPEDPKSVALQRMNVVRELRGAAHGSAVVGFGLEPVEAVAIKAPSMAGILGWSEPLPEVELRRDAWEQAEAATNRIVARAYAVLDAGELSELVDLVDAAQEGFS